MATRGTPFRPRSVAPLALVAVFALGASACDADDDDGEPDISVVDDDGVPFDPDVSPGVETNTDEDGNLGFDDVEP